LLSHADPVLMSPRASTSMNRGRLAGLCYLGVFLAGFVYIASIPHVGLVGNDVDAASAHIVSDQAAFWVGYASFLVSIALRLILMLLFFEMFKPVNERLSQLAVYFNITATSVQAVVALLLLAPIVLLTGERFTDSFPPTQLEALAATLLRLGYYAYTIGLVFFAGYDLLIGYLALRSTFLPRTVGVLMMITGLGWLTFIAPSVASRLLPINLIAGVAGEAVMIAWLLLRGVDEDRWIEAAAARSTG